jgi:hypothetical protein
VDQEVERLPSTYEILSSLILTSGNQNGFINLTSSVQFILSGGDTS